MKISGDLIVIFRPHQNILLPDLLQDRLIDTWVVIK